MAATEPAPERRLTPRGGELISAVSALVLVVAMFALKWFGLVVTPGAHAATPEGCLRDKAAVR